MAGTGQKIGLMWVGVQHYPTVEGFVKEALRVGVSKRVGVLPRDVKVGTWIALAHPRAITLPDNLYKPGIFYLFRVSSLQYVVKGDEGESELAEIQAKGFELVDVKPITEQGKLLNDSSFPT